MPTYSVLWSEHSCPHCGEHIGLRADQTCFQWGQVGVSYSEGESIEWARTKDGLIVPPCTWTREGTWNCGDPSVADVLLCDPEVLQYSEALRRCTTCGERIAAIAVRIRNGQITGPELLAKNRAAEIFGPAYPEVIAGCVTWPDEPARRTLDDLWDRQPNGAYLPRLSWYDQPLQPANE